MATTYSNRSNTIRAAKKAGYTKDDIVISTTAEGRFYYEPKQTEAQKEEDARLAALYGHTNCPECDIHLSNGVCDFEGLVDAQDGDMNRAYQLQKKEFACMACDAEWGADALAPADTKEDEPKKPGKRKYKKSGENSYDPSTVDGPVALAWGIYDELVAAKGRDNIVRKEFIADAIGSGINPNTASTQFNAWRKARGYELAK